MREFINFKTTADQYVTSDPMKAAVLMTFCEICPEIVLTDNLFFLFPKTEELKKILARFKMNYRRIYAEVQQKKQEKKISHE